MTRRRSPIALLCALAALLVLPAHAAAQDLTPPSNDTVLAPSGWLTSPYVVTLVGSDPDTGIQTMQWRLNGSADTDALNNTQITITDNGTHNFETRAINGDGVTILLVEQNVRQALTLAHRGCVLESGRMVLEGPARDLLGDERLKRAYLGL